MDVLDPSTTCWEKIWVTLQVARSEEASPLFSLKGHGDLEQKYYVCEGEI